MRHRLLRVPLRLLALLVVVGCGGTGPAEPTERVPTTITITPDDVILTSLNQAFQLSARVEDQSGVTMPTTIEWSVADATVASIGATGLITAVAVGSTTVTAVGLGLTATVNVEVVQQVSSFLVTQGNNQEAIRDSTLADPIIITVTDAGGTPIPDLPVTFTPAANNGTVTVDSVDTDANGEATTVWTLGSIFGEQELLVSLPTRSITVDAIARAEVPTPDLAVVTELALSTTTPTTLDLITATASIKNLGDLASGLTRVSLTANAVEVGTFDLPSLDPNDSTEVQFDIGTLSEGTTTLTFMADADGVITELFESNNTASRAVNVVAQTQLTIDVPLSNLSGAANSKTLYRVDMPAGPPTTLTLTMSGGGAGQDVDIFAEGGTRPPSTTTYNDCIGEGPDANEVCQIPFASGTYHVSVEGLTAYSGVSLVATLGDPLVPFDIEIVFLDSLSTNQKDAVFAAAARWEQVVVADLRDLDFTTSPIPANTCGVDEPAYNTVLDDLVIYVQETPIDGPGDILAQAGPCLLREFFGLRTILPLSGVVNIDASDANNPALELIVTHEIGHVLGFGTLWDWPSIDLLRNPSVADTTLSPPRPAQPGVDTHFIGEGAIAAFDALGGSGYPDLKVPVENNADRGSSDSHWRESVMQSELMTPAINPSQFQPLSELSIRSLGDIGYGVNPTAGETFGVPAFAAPPAIQGKDEGLLDMSDDIWRGPLGVIDRDGRIRMIRR